MAAVISGNGLGLYNSSLNIIGGGTSATIGQQGNQVYLNAATGNLVVRQRDEFVAGQGADFALIRTYNSQGTFDGDNNDNWRLNVYQSLVLSGTANTLGSTITKTYGDGSQSVFNYDTGLGYYTSTDGDGAHDTISQSGSNWVWSSGDGTVTETYNAAGQLISIQDADGNTRSYTYTGSLITQITDSSGQTINLIYSGNNLQRVDTISSGVTQSRVSYGYDASNRLQTVTVDLSPADNSTVDGNTFSTTYTYDGSSTRIASISHSDGATVSFTYDASNRVSTITEGSGADAQTTEYRYDYSTQELTVAANGAALSTAGSSTQTTTYTLNNGALNRHTLNTGALSTTETVITETPYAMLGTAPITTGEPVWTDDFARADGADIGNGWIEKTPGSFSLAGGAVSKNAGSTNQRLNLVYRPASEDILDAEASMEFNWNSGNLGYPQLFVRGQASTIASTDPNVLDAYVLFADETMLNRAYMRRETSSGNADIATVYMTESFAVGNTYRMRLSAEGTTTVNLQAIVERWDSGGSTWVQIGTASYADTATNRISTAGTVGFSGYTEGGSYTIDNFVRTPLNVTPDHYLVQAGDSWSSIATALYGTADLANELAALYPALTPTAGDQLFDLPATLVDSQSSLITVPAYYAVQAGDTWESIATLLYGDAALAGELQSATNNPDLATTSKLENLPGILVNSKAPGSVDRTHDLLATAPLAHGPDIWGDNFNRPDGANLGNGWIEKAPDSFSLINGAVVKEAVASAYKDNLAYRPASEDILDVQATLEFTLTSASVGYPQVFVRGQAGTIGIADTMDAYMVYMDNSGTQAILARQAGSLPGTHLSTINLSEALVQGGQYRFRLSAEGTATVTLQAYIERWDGSAWNVIGQATTTDASVDRIATAGTVGFGGHTESGYRYDNFSRTPLNAAFDHYLVEVGDSWGSIAEALYGTADVGDELAALYPSVTLAGGEQLFNLPASLVDSREILVDAESYYWVQSGDTWADIATAVYGNADAANELQTALGNPALTAGTRLTGLPGSIEDVQQNAATIADYYTVQSGDTWASIALTVYGNSQAEVVAALQEAMGNPALTTGLQLTVPQTLAYSVLSSEIDSTSVIDPLGRISTYRHDNAGRLIEALSPALNTGQRLSTRYQYDAQDNLLKVTDGLGHAVNYDYDGNGNLLRQQDAAGNVVEYSYTASNQLATETVYLKPDPDGAGALTAAEPQTTHYVYNDEDRLRFIVSPDGAVTEHRYDSAGNRISTLNYIDDKFIVPTSDITTVANSNAVNQQANLIGQITNEVDLERGSVIRLSDANARAELGTPLDLGSDWSIGAWFKNLGPDYWKTLTRGFAGDHQIIVNDIGLLGSFDNIGGRGFVSSGFDMNTLTGGWHHVTAVGSGNSTTFYIDGVAVGTIDFQSTSDVYSVGNYQGGSQRFAEYIDDVAVYNRALGITEISQLYSGGADFSDPALHLYWQIDTNTRVNVNDATGNYQGALKDNTALSLDAERGLVLRYGDLHSRVLLNEPVDLPADWSIGAWFKNLGDGTWKTLTRGLGFNHQVIVDINGELGSYDNAGGRHFVGSGFNMNTLSGGWHHVAAVGSGSSTTFYIDGVAVGSIDFKSATDVYAVGNYQYGGQRFAEYIDDLAIYGRALNATEIQTLFNEVVDTTDATLLAYLEVSELSEGNLTAWAADLRRDLSRVERTDYNYDFRSQLSSVTSYSATLASGAGDAATASTVHYIYDQAGQLIKTVDPRGAAPTGSAYQAGNFETHFVYDGLGRATQATDADGNITSTLYNDASQRIEVTQANGLVRTSVYDSQGRLVSVSEYDPADLATPLSDSRHIYDANGRLRAVQDANGVITHNLYDEAGRLVATIDGVGALTEYVYDANSQLAWQITYATALNSSTLAQLFTADGGGVIQSVNEIPLEQIRPQTHTDDRRHYNYYDEAGRLIFEIDGEGYVTEYRYDGAGQRVDTIQHSTAFPGFINNSDAGAQVTLSGTAADIDALLNWSGQTIAANSQINATITEEETGNQISVDVDLATNTGTVNVTRPPTQIYDTDNRSSTATRTLSNENVTVGRTYSPDIIPPLSNYASTAYTTTPQSLNLQVSNSTTYDSGISSSGVVTGLTVPTTYNGKWQVVVSGASHTSFDTTSGSSTINLSGLGLAPGNYTVQKNGYAPHPNPAYPGVYIPSIFGGGKSFTIGVTVGSVVTIPSLTGATSVDFYHRDASATGTGGYELDSEHDFSIGISSAYNDTWRDFKIVYKNAGGQAIAVSTGQFYVDEAGVTNTTITAYDAVAGTGTVLLGALTDTEVGNVGDELSTTLDYVDARVYLAGTSTLVSSARSYPNIIKDIQSQHDGRITLSNGSVLADGLYDVVIDKYYIGGASTLGVPVISNLQIGDLVRHVQEISWPSSTQVMEGGDTARFFFRKVGDASYTELPLVLDGAASGQNTYFELKNNNFTARLYDLDNAANYEYYVEYRASDQRLLKWSGTAAGPNTFNTNDTLSGPVTFSYNQDTVTANTGGTRLNGFLSPADSQLVDYLSVRITDTTSSTVVHDGVLTIPRLEANYLGELNLTVGTPLANGSYSIEVTRYFKDSSVSPQVDMFNHEVGRQTINSQALTVSVSGDEVTASFTGNLTLAQGITLTANTATGALSLNSETINAGPYSYTQRITDPATGFTEDAGRFMVYADASPTVAAVSDFYENTRTVSVDVLQGIYTTYRSAVLPTGISYAGSAQATTTVQSSSAFDMTVASTQTVDSSNIAATNSLDISAAGGVVRVVSVYQQQSDGGWLEVYAESDNINMNTRFNPPYLRQNPPYDTFNIPSYFEPGDYEIRVRTVNAAFAGYNLSGYNSYAEYMLANGTPPPSIENYSWGSTYYDTFTIGGLPQSATISWDASTLPAGYSYTFEYGLQGAGATQAPLNLQLIGGNLVATLGADAATTYDYRIEYRDADGNLYKKSGGTFNIDLGVSHTTSKSMIEYTEIGEPINGSSIIHNTYATQGSTISQIRAWVYDKESGVLVSGPVTTIPSTFSNYIGQINLQESIPLADGAYDIDLEITRTNSAVETPARFSIEVGDQAEEKPATELRWDATNRPRNTNVYFRYKRTAVAEYDPQNMWIRATASQTVQGEYYVKFPQITPSGQALDPLTEGQYDYMVIYIDRDTGKEVEASVGQFDVIYQTGLSQTHNLTFTRDLGGRFEHNYFNAQGQLQGVVNSQGYLTENIYDAAGRLVQTIQYAAPVKLYNGDATNKAILEQSQLSDLRPVAGADDLHSYIKYNNQGQVVMTVNAEGYVVENIYDAAGNVTQTIEYANKTTATDIANSSVATIRPVASATADRITVTAYTAMNRVASITNRIGATVISVTEFEYDAMGNLLRSTNALGVADERSALSRYDLQGRLTASMGGEGSQALTDLLTANPSATQAEIDAVWQQYAVNYEYDAAGQQTKVVDQFDNAQRHYYDANGNIRYSINAMGEVQELLYNSFGQVSHTIAYNNRLDSAALASLAGGLLTPSVRNVLNALRDPAKDSVVEQAYDHRGLVVSRKDELGYNTGYQYNAFAELRFQLQDADSASPYTVEHIYDNLGRKTNVLGIADEGQINIGMDYDQFGRLTASYTYDAEQNKFYHYSNSYDKLGRLLDKLEVRDAATANVHSVNGFSYDAFGRVLTQSDGNGGVTTYSYNDLTQTITVTMPEGISTSTTKNVHGETVSVVDGNGNTSSFVYDKNGKLTQSTDGEGNVSSNAYDDGGRLSISTDANGTQVQFNYDAASRVIERIVDPSGLNLKTQTVYDAQGQVIQSIDADGVVTETHYDQKGQVVAVIVDAEQQAVTYTPSTTPANFTPTDELQVSPKTNNIARYSPSITGLADGGYVAVWISDEQGSQDLNIFAQRYNAQDQAIGAEIQVSTSTDPGMDNNYDPKVVATDDGGFVVAWENQNNTTYGEIYLRRYNNQGEALTAELVVNTTAAGSQLDPAVTVLKDGSYVVAWMDMVSYRIYSRRLDAEGNALTGEVQVDSGLAAYNMNPEITALDNGGYVVSWGSTLEDANGDIFARVFDNQGQAVTDEYRINTTTVSSQSHSAVTALSDGSFVVVWQSTNQQANGTEYDIVGRRYDANGNALGAEFDVNTYILNKQERATVSALADGGFMVAWTSQQPGDGDTQGIYAQRFDSTGATVGSEFKVNTPNGRSHYSPSLAMLHDGSYIIAWSSESLPGSTGSINARRYQTDQDMIATTQVGRGENLALGTYYTYDSRGNRLSVSVGSQPGVVQSVGDDGYPLFDSNGLPIQEYQKALSTTSYVYDNHGRLIQEVVDPTVTWTDAQGVEHTETGLHITTTYAYDVKSNLAAQTNGRGFTTRYVHDAFGRLIYTIAELENDRGLVTENRYDDNDRLINVVQYANTVSLSGVEPVLTVDEAAALVAGLATAEDRLQQQVYDIDGRLIYTISPTGLISENVYDNNGNIIQTISYSQSIAAGTYTTVTAVQSAITAASDAAPEQNAWSVYDANGRAVFNIDGLGYLTANDYDSNGNLTRSIAYATAIDTAILNDANADNRGQITGLLAGLANAADQVTRYSYDRGNRQVYKVDALGYITESQYDKLGRVVASIEYNTAYTVASAAPSVAEIKALLPSVPGAADRITQSIYDAAGRVIASKDAQGNEESYQYDLAGNRTRYTNALGHSWSYVYDAANRLVEERSPQVAVTQLDATLWQQGFDSDFSGLYLYEGGVTNPITVADGRLEMRTRDNATEQYPSVNGERVYSFDDRTRFQTELTLGDGAAQRHVFYGIHNSFDWSTPAGGYRRHGVLITGDTAYSTYYDSAGWQPPVELGKVENHKTYVIEVVTHEQGTTLYFREKGVPVEQGYQHTVSETDWVNVNAMAYVQAMPGAEGSVVYFNHMRELLPHDRALMDEAASLSGQTQHQSVITRMEYNALGDLSARVEAVGTANERRTSYVYDSLNRQTQTLYPEVGVYDYVDSAQHYASSRQETLQTLSDLSYYDTFGNEVLQVDTAGNRSYKVYDANNRLVYEVDAKGHVTKNNFDAFGNVVGITRYANAITLPTGPIDILNPGLSIADLESTDPMNAQRIIADANADRSLTREYDALNRVTQVQQATTTVVTALSAQGNATLGSAAATTQNQYDAFGRLIKQSELSQGGVWLDTHFYYDLNGRLLAKVDPMGFVTQQEYDHAGNTTRQIEYAQAINLAAVGLDLTSWASVQTHIVSNTAVAGTDSATGFDRETTFTYDHANRVITQTRVNVLVSNASAVNAGTDPGGAGGYDATFTDSVVNLSTSYAYDAVGNITATVDEAGNTSYQFYDALGRVTGETQVTRTQQRYGLTAHTTVFVDEAGGDNATLRWARPPIPGLNVAVNVRAVGATSWTALTVTENGDQLEALIGALPSDQYEYELSYTRQGETEVYATVSGSINVDTGKSSGSALTSTNIAYRADVNGDVLYFSGNTTGMSGVLIDGVTYTATNLGNDNYRVDLHSLLRGNYDFTTVGAVNNLSGTVQKLSGDLGGGFAIQTTDLQIQYMIKQQAIYTVNDVNAQGVPSKGYWGENSMTIEVPSLDHLGTENLRYEISLEYSNVKGERTYKTFKGDVDGTTIRHYSWLRNSSHEDYGRLEGVRSIKLWRDDVNTAYEIEQEQTVSVSLVHSFLYEPQAPAATVAYRESDLVFESSGGVDSQQLEFINLPANTETAVIKFWLSGTDSMGAAEKTLNKIGSGYFTIGQRDIPAGAYDFEILSGEGRTVVASGSNVFFGNGVDGVQSVSQPAVSSADQQALITPLTRHQYDHFGNVVSSTRYANSASFNSDGTVNVLTDALRDQTDYRYYDTHGHLVHQQDAESHGRFFSYDDRGQLAKQWQWIDTDSSANVAGDRLYTGTVYRYDAVGQQTETITTTETMTLSGVSGLGNRVYGSTSLQSSYNAFGEISQRGRDGGNEEYFHYDQAGRLWRSNAAGSGSSGAADKIYLYDVRGNLQQQLSSQTLDLSTATYDYANLATTAGLSTVQKTSYVYDALGRVTQQINPSRVQGATTYQPVIDLVLDRWGNISKHIDAADVETDYRYNQADQQIKEVRAANGGIAVVDDSQLATNANATVNVSPTTYSYYDRFGRQIGSSDANGGEQVMAYDEAGQQVEGIAADGAIQRFVYDAFGNQVEKIIYAGTTSSTPFAMLKFYDRNNRIVSERFPDGGETDYRYDAAGNRVSIRRLESIVGSTRTYQVSTYHYDNRGNVIEEIANDYAETYDGSGNLTGSTPNSDAVRIHYGYDLAGNKNLEQKYPQASTPITHTWQYDYFGRLTSSNDFGSGNTVYSYNYAGELTQESMTRGGSSDSKVYVYYQDGLLNSLSRGGITDTYLYDLSGLLTDETSVQGAATLYDNNYSYDALGRLTGFTGSGLEKHDYNVPDIPPVFGQGSGPNGRGYWLDMNYSYDALGNRRRVQGTEGMSPAWSYLTGDPTAGGVTVSGPAQYNLTSLDQWYTYDAANRVLVSRGTLNGAGNAIATTDEGSAVYSYNKRGNRIEAYRHNGTTWITENHFYDANGRVLYTTENGIGMYTSQRTYDLLGRVEEYRAYGSPGSLQEVRTSTYNANGQLSRQLVVDWSTGSAGATLADMRYDYANSYDSSGALRYYTLAADGTTLEYDTSYSYFAGAQTGTQSVTVQATSVVQDTSTHSYDAFGHLLSVSHSDSPSSNQSFTLNAYGTALHKEVGHHVTNYQQQFYYSHNNRTLGTGGQIETDFDFTSTPLSEAAGVAQGPGTYAVRTGDTLQSIALSVYGDSQRWYLIADANGLSGSSSLSAGQSLVIPNSVQSRNSTEAFRTFGTADIVGDTSPKASLPTAAPVLYDIQSKKSNAFVQIAALVVTVVVMAYLGPAGQTGMQFVGQAMGAAAVANVASQAVLIAGKEQKGFNAGSFVAQVASAGISQGVNPLGTQGATGLRVGAAMLSNIASQGINIAMGNQETFSWGSLAASAVGAGDPVLGNPIFTEVIAAKIDGREFNAANAAQNAFASGLGDRIKDSRETKPAGAEVQGDEQTKAIEESGIQPNVVKPGTATEKANQGAGDLVVENSDKPAASNATVAMIRKQQGSDNRVVGSKPAELGGFVPEDYQLREFDKLFLGESTFVNDDGSVTLSRSLSAELGIDASSIDLTPESGLLSQAAGFVAGLYEFRLGQNAGIRQEIWNGVKGTANVLVGIAGEGLYQFSGAIGFEGGVDYFGGLHRDFREGFNSTLDFMTGGEVLSTIGNSYLNRFNSVVANFEAGQYYESGIGHGSFVAEGVGLALGGYGAFRSGANLLNSARNGMDQLNTAASGLTSRLQSPITLDSSGSFAYSGFAAFESLSFRSIFKSEVGLGSASHNLGLLDNVAPASIHPGYWASVSGNVTEQSIIRALRQNGSVEALATAQLIKRGKVNLRLEATDPFGQGAAGRQPYFTNEVIVALDKVGDPAAAAGFAAHETKHFLQKLTPEKYLNNALEYELEAYRWQRRVDPDFFLKDDFEVEQFLKLDPLYPTIN